MMERRERARFLEGSAMSDGKKQTFTGGETALLAAASGLVGFFLAARFAAFCRQAWGLGFGAYFAPVLALCCAAAALALRGPLRRAAAPGRTAAAALALSALCCIPLRRLVVDRAVLGGGLPEGGAYRGAMLAGAVLLLAAFFLLLLRALRTFLPAAGRWLRSLSWGDLLFVLALLAVLNGLAVLYMRGSSTVYFWDNAGYWDRARTLAETSKSGLRAVFSAVYASVLTEDYNLLIVLPFVPIVRLFGGSRLVFVLCIVNLDLVPVCLLVHGLARRYGRRGPAAAVAALLSLPMLFYLTLVGFVDVGGVFFALAALALCLRPTPAEEPPAAALVPAGCFLAAAVLLRRWYAFFALSLVLAEAVRCLLFRRRLTRPLWLAGGFAFCLLFLFQPLVSGLLLGDYAAAYASYALSLRTDFLLLFRYFGLFTLLCAGVSCGLGLRARESREEAALPLLQVVLCFVIFTRVQTHGQQHLLLYVPAVLLLLLPLYARLARRAREDRAAAAALLLSAALPALSPFLPRNQPAAVTEIRAAAVLPSFSWMPPVRADALELVRLVRWLDETAGAQGETVGVLASSFVLNADILKNAEDSLSLSRVSDVSRSYLRTLPAVDSRDTFPGALFDCDYLLVADPVQLHLGEENQQVVALPAQAVLAGEGFGTAYAPLAETFYLGDGSVTVRLYRRTRPVTEAERAALTAAVAAAEAG